MHLYVINLGPFYVYIYIFQDNLGDDKLFLSHTSSLCNFVSFKKLHFLPWQLWLPAISSYTDIIFAKNLRVDILHFIATKGMFFVNLPRCYPSVLALHPEMPA